jgi:hypothetical protein
MRSRATPRKKRWRPTARGGLSLTEAASRLQLDAWGFFELLRRRGENLNVTLEDWIDSRAS